MSAKESVDVIVGRELLLPPDAIRHARIAWNENKPMRAVLAYRLNDMLRERRQQLEIVAPEKLGGVQAEVALLKKILSAQTQTET